MKFTLYLTLSLIALTLHFAKGNDNNTKDKHSLCTKMISLQNIIQKTKHCKPYDLCFNELRRILMNTQDFLCDSNKQPKDADKNCYAFCIKGLVIDLLEAIANSLVDVKDKFYRNGKIPCNVIQAIVDYTEATLQAEVIAFKSQELLEPALLQERFLKPASDQLSEDLDRAAGVKVGPKILFTIVNLWIAPQQSILKSPSYEDCLEIILASLKQDDERCEM